MQKQREESMVGYIKLIYFVILFLCLFVFVTNIEGKSFSSFLNLFLYFLKYFNYIIFYIIFLTALERKCSWDSECPKDMCRYPAKVKCIYHKFCKCMPNFINPA